EQRLNFGVKVFLIHRIDLRSNPQGNPNPLGYLNRMIRPLLGSNTPQEGQIPSGIRMHVIEISWQTVIDGCLPIGPGDRSPLGIRDRYQRHFSIFTKHRLEFRQIEPTMECGQRWSGIPPREREAHEIEMRVNNVEVA